MKDLITTIWLLPQSIIGVLLFIFYYKKAVNIEYIKGSLILFADDFKGGISLGKFIIVSNHVTDKTIRHELGHSKQSLYLGPLYLLVIGLPSILHALIYNISMTKWNYYSFYTEKWADKLAGIRRN